MEPEETGQKNCNIGKGLRDGLLGCVRTGREFRIGLLGQHGTCRGGGSWEDGWEHHKHRFGTGWQNRLGARQLNRLGTADSYTCWDLALLAAGSAVGSGEKSLGFGSVVMSGSSTGFAVGSICFFVIANGDGGKTLKKYPVHVLNECPSRSGSPGRQAFIFMLSPAGKHPSRSGKWSRPHSKELWNCDSLLCVAMTHSPSNAAFDGRRLWNGTQLINYMDLTMWDYSLNESVFFA